MFRVLAVVAYLVAFVAAVAVAGLSFGIKNELMGMGVFLLGVISAFYSVSRIMLWVKHDVE